MASSPGNPPVVGLIMHTRGEDNNLTDPDEIEDAMDNMFSSLERDMLLNLANQYKDELGIVNPPLAYAFTGVSHIPLGPKHPVKDFIWKIMDMSIENKCEAIIVLRSWDSITAHKESFLEIFERCIDQCDLRVRLKIFNKNTHQVEGVKHFVDVDPADVYMRLAGFFDPDDPSQGGFGRNTELFIGKLEQICKDAMVRPSLDPLDGIFDCSYSFLPWFFLVLILVVQTFEIHDAPRSRTTDLSQNDFWHGVSVSCLFFLKQSEFIISSTLGSVFR